MRSQRDRPLRRAAIDLNAGRTAWRLRGWRPHTIGSDDGWDVVLAGDVCYERAWPTVLAWLETLKARGAKILIGDPGRNYFPKARFEHLARYEVPVTRALEDAEIKTTNVWRM